MKKIKEDAFSNYSNEVQDVLGKVPSRILRFCLCTLLFVVGLLLIGSFVFKYLDKIIGEIHLIAIAPTQTIVARTSGYIDSIFHYNGATLDANDIIASIENPSKLQSVLRLEEKIVSLLPFLQQDTIPLKFLEDCLSLSSEGLEGLSAPYNQWHAALKAIIKFQHQNYYFSRLQLEKELALSLAANLLQAEHQQRLQYEQYELTCKQFARDSLLYAKGISSYMEYEKSLSRLKQSENSSLESLSKISACKQSMIQNKLLQQELIKHLQDESSQLQLELKSSTTGLLSAISLWKEQFLLISPIRGHLTYWGERFPHQYIQAGDPVFTITPSTEKTQHGIAYVGIEKSGLVSAGQQVYIRLANFPDTEFGYLRGSVEKISALPNKEGKYLIDIKLENGLVTSYGKELPVDIELSGTAEIITTEYRLIERFIMPIRKILTQHI